MPSLHQERENFKNQILDSSIPDFEGLALELFEFQAANCSVYKEYLHLIGRKPHAVKSLSDIPFLPITLFKKYEVRSTDAPVQVYFLSSGTAGQESSRHALSDPDFYEQISKQIFEENYGPLSNYQIFALLPSYLERGQSSLVYMVNHFLKFAQNGSAFFLNDFKKLKEAIWAAESQAKPYILWGVSYALLDLADYFSMPLKNALVIETGGMKGKRKELTKWALHQHLKNAWQLSYIGSEYGMTELFSQAYSKSDGIFCCPKSLKVLLRDPNDPFDLQPRSRQGGINVIDLANVDSCSFIETQDLGFYASNNDSFELAGRMTAADLRGCNLMLD